MILVTDKVHTQLRYAAEHNTFLEVGGFGRTHLMEDGTIFVDELYIPPQVVEGGHTDIKGPDEDGGANMLDDARRFFSEHCRHCRLSVYEHEGADHEPEGESQADWRLWWHSHGKRGGTFGSGTDHATLFGLAKDCGGWAVGVVIDASGGRYAWVAVVDETPVPELVGYPKAAQELLKRVYEKDIPYKYYMHEDEAAKAQVSAWMDSERVKRKVYVAPVWQQSRGGGHQGGAHGKSSTDMSKVPLLFPGQPKKSMLEMSEAEWLEYVSASS